MKFLAFAVFAYLAVSYVSAGLLAAPVATSVVAGPAVVAAGPGIIGAAPLAATGLIGAPGLVGGAPWIGAGGPWIGGAALKTGIW